MTIEETDAVVVGARCAGSAAATALARAGRRVVALDRARFPSDTLSTHLLFSGGVLELQALGALERVEALGAPHLPVALMHAGGMTVSAFYGRQDGIEHGMCVRRPGLDAALVATARAAGADVRERVKVTGLVREGGRVCGVRCTDADGREREIRAPLVVGADGRRSTVARLVGAAKPYRTVPNGRACAFGYWRDARNDWRLIAAQWRDGPDLGTAFPCDDGLVMVLVMPPVALAPELRADPEGAYRGAIERLPGLRERLRGCELATKIRVSTDHPSFFRHSAGPGWALAGDAGHFKDPVTAQGIRDALRYGRRLGERAAPVLDDERRLDAALRAWEREREDDCLEVYQWTNLLARAEPLNPIEAEAYREFSHSPGLGSPMLDVFARRRRPSEVFSPVLSARLGARALAHRGRRREAARIIAREGRIELAARAERRAARRAWASR